MLSSQHCQSNLILDVRCLVQTGLFCWLIQLINPINYFGDFHNTLAWPAILTLYYVQSTDFNMSQQRFNVECYVCSSYLNLLSVLSNCVGFAFLKNLARCSIHTQCPQSLQIRASWESFLHKHGPEQNIFIIIHILVPSRVTSDWWPPRDVASAAVRDHFLVSSPQCHYATNETVNNI